MRAHPGVTISRSMTMTLAAALLVAATLGGPARASADQHEVDLRDIVSVSDPGAAVPQPAGDDAAFGGVPVTIR